MTAKEKAQELVKKFRMYDIMICDPMGYELEGYEERHYKRCALISVDEIIQILPTSEYLEDVGNTIENRERTYWKQVKQEIENF